MPWKSKFCRGRYGPPYEMVYVICVAKIESNTFSVILCMMKKITTISSIDVTIIVGAEQLRDIFLRKTGNKYLYFTGPILSEVNLPSETV